MIRWFHRADPEDEVEAEGDEFPLPQQIDFGEPAEHLLEVRPLPQVPQFAVIVAATAINGWHMAAVVTNMTGPDFYLRAITVRRPFMVARPVPSTRASDRPIKPAMLSPSGSTPTRKLPVNWGWAKLEDSFYQLRFYVKRTPAWWLPNSAPLKTRLTLKESGGPRRRIVVPVKSNAINWGVSALEKLASPPERSTGIAPP